MDTKDPATEIAIGPATSCPTPGAFRPFTVDSDHEAVGTLISIDPGDAT
jgi:hypothetical protein